MQKWEIKMIYLQQITVIICLTLNQSNRYIIVSLPASCLQIKNLTVR